MDKNSRFGVKKEVKTNHSFGLNDWKIFDILLFSRGMSEVLKIVEGWIESEAKNKPTSLKLRRPRWIATVNPEFVMKSIKDKSFRELLTKTDLNVVDGVGLVWAKELDRQFVSLSDVSFLRKFMVGAKVGGEILRGKHREGLVTGADLMPELCKLASEKGYKVFFLGGFSDRAKRTADYFRSQMSDLRCQISSGEPDFSNEQVLKKINEFKPDILFVAYGMKKQEEWIKVNRNKADFGVVIGVGRSFDYYSGDLKRAPKMWRKIGMEWLYSLIKEPKRWRRQLELPKFVWKVLTN